MTSTISLQLHSLFALGTQTRVFTGLIEFEMEAVCRWSMWEGMFSSAHNAV